MSEIYKFYVQMDGVTYGPYSAHDIRDLELLDDILVTEESMNGQWLPASKFDFDAMASKEEGRSIQSQLSTPKQPQHIQHPVERHDQPYNIGFVINPDGTVTNSKGWQTPDDSNSKTCAERKPRNNNGWQTPYDPNRVPPEIKKWNWGAFFFNWIWGVCNGVYWPLVLIICSFIPIVGPIISLVACIILGVNGSEWAWKAKRWNSAEHFKRVQHKWAMACLWVIGISLFVALMAAISGK